VLCYYVTLTRGSRRPEGNTSMKYLRRIRRDHTFISTKYLRKIRRAHINYQTGSMLLNYLFYPETLPVHFYLKFNKLKFVLYFFTLFLLEHSIARTIVTATFGCSKGVTMQQIYKVIQQFLSWKGTENPTCE
jgi:hypothetical protein